MENSKGKTKPNLLTLSAGDHVAVVVSRIAEGESYCAGGSAFRAARELGLGHKIAVKPIASGERVLKYGAPIGRATRDIAVGEHVHVHNLASDYTPSYVLPETAEQ